MTKESIIKHLKVRRRGILSSFTWEDLDNPITRETITEALEMIDKQRGDLDKK